MTGQSNAAAERSFHEAPPEESACFVCGGPWRKGKGGTSSYAARCLPPLAQVCSAECAADPKFKVPVIPPDLLAAMRFVMRENENGNIPERGDPNRAVDLLGYEMSCAGLVS